MAAMLVLDLLGMHCSKENRMVEEWGSIGTKETCGILIKEGSVL